MTNVTMTRPAYHTMPMPQRLATRQPVIIENVALTTPVRAYAAPTPSGSATELAEQGARNCWDPRAWGTQITPVVPAFIGWPEVDRF